MFIELQYDTFDGIKALAVERCSLTEKSMPQRTTNNQQLTTNIETWRK